MMSNFVKPSMLAMSAFASTLLLASGTTVSAQEIDVSDPAAVGNYAEFKDPSYGDFDVQNGLPEDNSNSLEQVTNVNQLRDVAPTDWAYEALRSLVDRYGCIAGFPNQTYRGNQPLSRYEFAAGLNSCLNQIERLIASSEAVSQEDLETVKRLTEEFEAEIATLGGRVDEIESRTALLEDNAFSTTSTLQGEAAFTLAQAFGDETNIDINGNSIVDDEVDSELVFTNRVRLQIVSSFTGKDKLFTRLTAGNIDNSFQDETGTREGRFAFDGQADNDIRIDRLHYSFPLLNDKLQVTAMASLAAHHFYAEVFNDGLNAGGGATGALTRFGERSPIYRFGIANSSAGLGATYAFNEKFEVSAGYISPTASNPDEENGLFNGAFSALGQLTVKPIEKLKFGLTYVRSYDPAAQADPPTAGGRAPFLWGGTGTNLANFRSPGINIENIATDSFGAQAQFDITPQISLRGWFSYTDANLVQPGDNGEATLLNYAGAVVVSDLVKEGSTAALIVGAEPYLDSIDADGDGNDFEDLSDDIPLHIEAFYKYPLNDNISITPGLIWLTSPNQNSENDDIYIGALRTTFTF